VAALCAATRFWFCVLTRMATTIILKTKKLADDAGEVTNKLEIFF
jgi:hypothetical protein